MNFRVPYTVFDGLTGQILWVGYCAPGAFGAAEIDGRRVYSGHPPASNMRVDLTNPQSPVFAPMIECPYTIDKMTITANASDTATISGLPEGAEVDYFSEDTEIVDSSGSVNFAIDVPGEYVITIRHPAYLLTTITITATPVS